jgi:hypothetical protein
MSARRFPPPSFSDDSNEDYSERGPNRASIIRLASATISSVRLFSRLDGLSANGRVHPGAKIEALQPFPTELTSIRYPLYSMTVIARRCPFDAVSPNCDVGASNAAQNCTSEARRVGHSMINQLTASNKPLRPRRDQELTTLSPTLRCQLLSSLSHPG